MLKLGKGKNVYYLVTEVVNTGMTTIDIKITDNETWAKANNIIGKIKADSLEDAKDILELEIWQDKAGEIRF